MTERGGQSSPFGGVGGGALAIVLISILAVTGGQCDTEGTTPLVRSAVMKWHRHTRTERLSALPDYQATNGGDDSDSDSDSGGGSGSGNEHPTTYSVTSHALLIRIEFDSELYVNGEPVSSVCDVERNATGTCPPLYGLTRLQCGNSLYESHPPPYNAGHSQHRPFLHHILHRTRIGRSIYTGLIVISDPDHSHHHSSTHRLVSTAASAFNENDERWNECTLEVVATDERSWPYPLVLHTRDPATGAEAVLNGISHSIPLTAVSGSDSPAAVEALASKPVRSVLYTRYSHSYDNPHLLPWNVPTGSDAPAASASVEASEDSTSDTDRDEPSIIAQTRRMMEQHIRREQQETADDTNADSDSDSDSDSVLLETSSAADSESHTHAVSTIQSDSSNAIASHMTAQFSSTLRIASASQLRQSTAMRQRALELQQTEHLMLLVSHFTSLSREQVFHTTTTTTAANNCVCV